MKKVFLLFIASSCLLSCGYSEEEQAQMQQESAAKTDSAADDIAAELGLGLEDSSSAASNTDTAVIDSVKK